MSEISPNWCNYEYSFDRRVSCSGVWWLCVCLSHVVWRSQSGELHCDSERCWNKLKMCNFGVFLCLHRAAVSGGAMEVSVWWCVMTLCVSESCCVTQPVWGTTLWLWEMLKQDEWCVTLVFFLCLHRAAVSGGAMELRASPYTSLLLLVGLTVGIARNLGEWLSHIDRCCGIMVLIECNMDTWKANGRSSPDKLGSFSRCSSLQCKALLCLPPPLLPPKGCIMTKFGIVSVTVWWLGFLCD